MKKTRYLWLVIAIGIVIALPFAYSATVNNAATGCRDWAAELKSAQAELSHTTEPESRFYVLTEAAKAAAETGDYILAESLANELLASAASFRRNWNYGNAVHDGHTVLGRVALHRQNREEAVRQLLLAADTPGSPQLNSFGPNMLLARDLLAAGERRGVLEYFAKCRRFWELEGGRLSRWERMARFNIPPDFGANLLY